MLQITRRSIGRNINYFNFPKTISGELVGSRAASALGIIATGYAPALALCRKLIAAGVDPRTRLELFRKNGTLAITVCSISEGAQLRIDGNGTRFERLPDGLQQGRPAAPPMRQNRPAAGAGWADWSPAPDDEGAP